MISHIVLFLIRMLCKISILEEEWKMSRKVRDNKVAKARTVRENGVNWKAENLN